MPNAGEPKGFGEIGVPIRIGNQKIEPGDWLLGDDDGVTVLPRKNRGGITPTGPWTFWKKKNRIREEIKEGRTLAQVTDC